MNKISLNAAKRSVVGRKVKKLRTDGKIPANVFGRKIVSQTIEVNQKEFEKIYSDAGETGVVELNIGNDKRPVLIHNLQKDPISDQVLHVDFLQVDLKQKVTAQVPIELVNESPAEKQSLGTVVQYLNEIEVEALPTELPDRFEIDLTNLAEVDQMFLVKDLKVDKTKVEIKAKEDEIIVKVEPPKEEKVEVVTPAAEEATAEGEQPVSAEQKPEGGEENKEETPQK